MTGHRIKSWVVGILSLIPTPFLLFVSTSSALYLRNQEDLDYQVQVLFPFLTLALAAMGVGFFFYLLSSRRVFRYPLYVYYFAGPFFLALSVAKGTPIVSANPALSWGLGAAILIIVPAFLSRRLRLKSAAGLLAIFALFLFASEAALFARGVKSPTAKDTLGREQESDFSGEMPNVYHIVIDTFQTEGFELYLTPEAERELEGFSFYPKNISAYWKTHLSFPSFFSGKLHDFVEPRLDYKARAFNSKQSFLYWLKKAGYTTYSYAFKKFPDQEKFFDYFVEPNAVVRSEAAVDHSRIFWEMWLYANLPEQIASRFVQKETLEAFEDKSLMTSSEPLKSHLTFLDFMAQEPDQPGSGRYVFVHMFTTHPPFIFGSDCSYSLKNGEVKEMGVNGSYRCGVKLIVDFVKLLKRLGRYDNSLIVIHSDHGHRQYVHGGRLQTMTSKSIVSDMELVQAVANSLLLVKPPGKGSGDPFLVSDAETTLLDLPPTLLDYLGIKANVGFEGVSLKNPPADRERYFCAYHYQEMERGTGAAHEFSLKDDKMRYVRTVPIKTTY